MDNIETQHPLWKDFVAECKKQTISLDNRVVYIDWWNMFLAGASAQMYHAASQPLMKIKCK